MTRGALSDFDGAEYPVRVYGVADAPIMPDAATESVWREVVSLDLLASAAATQVNSPAFTGRQR